MGSPRDDLQVELEALKRVARSILRNTADVDDVVQKAWIVAAESCVTPVGSRQGWLAGTVRLLVRSEARDRSRRTQREVRSARAEAILNDPSAQVSRVETVGVVRAAVSDLEEPQRSVVQLYFFEGLSTKDVAAQMDLSQASVQRYLRQANDSLRHRLRSEYEGSDRVLGLVLVGAFPWERSDLKGAAAAAKTGTASLGVLAIAKWFAAALLLIVGLGVATGFWGDRGAVNGLSDPGPDPELAASGSTDREESVAATATSFEANGDRRPVDPAPARTEEGRAAPASSVALAAAVRPPSTSQTLIVVDPNGVPVPGAELFHPLPNGEILLGSTGLDGRADVDFEESPSSKLYVHLDTLFVKVFARSSNYADTHCYVMERASQSRLPITLPFEGAPMQIRGRVLRPDGTPEAGALVERRHPMRQTGQQAFTVRHDAEGRRLEFREYRTLTDDRGEFLLSGLPRALHTLEVRAAGFVPATSAIGDSDRESVECTIQLELGGTVTGTVLTASGDPAINVAVYISPSKMTNVTPIRLETDDEGRFRLEGVTAAPTIIRAGNSSSRATLTLDVSGNGEHKVELRLKKMERFQVRLVDEAGDPIGTYPVEPVARSRRWIGKAVVTNEEGVAFIEEFPHEPLVLFVHKPGLSIPLTTMTVVDPTDGGVVEIVSPRAHASLGVAHGLLRVGGAIPPPGCRVAAHHVEFVKPREVAVDPTTGAFDLDNLPAGKYHLTMDAPNGARLFLRDLELMGVDADIGTVDAPPMGTLVFDWRWPEEETFFHRIRQLYSLPDGAGWSIMTIAEGKGEPVPQLDVPPGSYVVVVKDRNGRSLQQRAVLVRPGAWQPFILGPEQLIMGAVDLELTGTPPASLPVRIYAATIDDDTAFDSLDGPALAAHTTPANLSAELNSERGWNGAFPIQFTMDAKRRWILVTEWPVGRVHRIPLERLESPRGAVAPTFLLGTDGFTRTARWRD